MKIATLTSQTEAALRSQFAHYYTSTSESSESAQSLLAAGESDSISATGDSLSSTSFHPFIPSSVTSLAGDGGSGAGGGGNSGPTTTVAEAQQQQQHQQTGGDSQRKCPRCGLGMAADAASHDPAFCEEFLATGRVGRRNALPDILPDDSTREKILPLQLETLSFAGKLPEFIHFGTRAPNPLLLFFLPPLEARIWVSTPRFAHISTPNCQSPLPLHFWVWKRGRKLGTPTKASH